MEERINVLEVVYKDPKGEESGGVERYASNIKNVLDKKKFNIIFAFAYTHGSRINTKNEICIKIPNIPLFKKLIFNIKLYTHLKKTSWKGVVHINGDNGVFCTKLKGIRTVFTLHGSSLQYAIVLLKTKPIKFLDILGNILSGLMELYAYINADKITGVSEYCLDFMQKFKSRDHIVIPPGIRKIPFSMDKDRCLSDLKLNKKRLFCIFVGGSGERKGLNIAISTVGRIKNNEVRLLIVGPRKKPIINNKCIFLGRVTNLVLEKLYSVSDILFFPSNYEGFPTVIPEAMAYGVVPLVYDKKPFNELIDYNDGYLVKNKDEFSKMLSKIVKNRKELLKKKKHCRLKAKNFLIDKLFIRYSKIFEEVYLNVPIRNQLNRQYK
jgi:hypothetical protein